MSKLPLSQIALSLACVSGVLPVAAEANYRMVYKVHVRERGRFGGFGGIGPMAPPMMPFQTGYPMSMGGTCCGNVLAPAAPTVPAQPLILPPATSCGPAIQPMVQTQLRPQQIVTYRDVPRTEIRREAVQVNVPVTTYRQVMVDEGSYQQVWVPRQVTKMVPQTTVQQQVQYREIPVQTMERVQQVQTVLIPEQQIRYVQSGIYVPQAAAMVGPQPTIAVPNPPQTSQLPETKRAESGLEWQPVKPRLEPDNKTSAVEYGRTRAAGRFTPVSLPRTADDIQTALAD